MGEVQKKTSWLKLVLINFFVFVVLLVFLDIAAHFIPGLKPQQISLQIEDPLLGFRPNPTHPDHDSDGWKNQKVLTNPQILALGDSQTYGINAPTENSWPRQLAEETGKSIYQMAFGGFAPATYTILLDSIKKKNPKAVVAAYYLGNDNADAFILTKAHRTKKIDGFLQKFDLSESAIKASEIDPEFARRTLLDCQNPRIIRDPKTQQPEDVLNFDGDLARSSFSWSIFYKFLTPRSLWYYFNHSLEKFSVIYQILYTKFQWQLPLRTPYSAPICLEFRGTKASTLLTPAYRILGLTSTDPRIVEGEKINLESLQFLQTELKKSNIGFFVLLIPTKEFVFKSMIEKEGLDRTDEKYQHLTRLWDLETEARQRVLATLSQNQLSVIDVTDALIASLEAGQNPYNEIVGYPRFDGDGHPNSVGYKVIADEVNKHLVDILSSADSI